MDRQIEYPNQVLFDTDLLSMNKNAMIGLGLAILDILGSSTVVGGAACTATAPASLSVNIGPGRIYSLQNVDNTAYGSLPADTTDQIVKQGIQFGSVNIATPAPSTAGQSIVYLIEAQYQDSDTTNAVLPFFNSANPLVPESGQNNNGAPLPTQRKGLMVVQAKAGIPATTGSQTTPAPDAGFVGLYAVTVANGQATVTSANISQLPTAPFLELNLGTPTAAFQQSTMTIASNTTLQNTELSLNLQPGTYAMEMLLNFNALTSGAGGIKLVATGGTAVLSGQAIGPLTGSVNATPLNTTFNTFSETFATISVSTTVDYVAIKFSIMVSQAGTFLLQVAQNTSSADALQFIQGSYITATRL